MSVIAPEVPLPTLPPPAPSPETFVFGRSRVMEGLRARMERMAVTTAPVLIQGESGTGTERLARLIHQLCDELGCWYLLA